MVSLVSSMNKNAKAKILIVDDEKDIVELLSYNLSKAGYDIVEANNGSEALLIVDSSFDLIILDVMMPNVSGYDVCDVIKKNPIYSQIPIIFLTARNSTEDEYQGLIRGAEDYIVKPVSIKNLLIRVKNIIGKNTTKENNQILQFKDLSIDTDKIQVCLNGKKIKLTNKEFKLLYTLVKSPGKIFKRDELLDKVWGVNTVLSDRIIDVHIRKLRKKIEIKKQIILTAHGLGYYVENK